MFSLKIKSSATLPLLLASFSSSLRYLPAMRPKHKEAIAFVSVSHAINITLKAIIHPACDIIIQWCWRQLTFHCRWTYCGCNLLLIMSDIFLHTLLTVVLMIRLPMHCHLVHYFRAENELQYSPNVAQGDNNSRADSFCTLAIRECLWRSGPSRGLQPDWMSWLYRRWFIMLLDVMQSHKTRSSLISITTSRAGAGHSCVYFIRFPILIYVSFHWGKQRLGEIGYIFTMSTCEGS